MITVNDGQYYGGEDAHKLDHLYEVNSTLNNRLQFRSEVNSVDDCYLNEMTGI